MTVSLLIFFPMDNIMALELLSPTFKQGETIPLTYTCDGKNISPPLLWRDVPAGTKSLVLIVDDPDAPAGTWDHWLVYNIPANLVSLPEAIKQLPEGALPGKNSWNKLDYGGPCPPDREHRYFFKLYALDTVLPNKAGMTKKEIENAMNGHVITSSELITKYKR